MEGAFRVWLRNCQVNYFILRGEPIPRPPPPEGDLNDVKGMKNWVFGEYNKRDVVKEFTVHEQEDGTIIACCATGMKSESDSFTHVRSTNVRVMFRKFF